MAQPDVFYFDLDQFTDPCARGCEKADHEIPEHFIVSLQAGFEVFIVGLADDIFQKRFLLYSDKGLFPLFLANALQITVNSSETQVYRLWLITVDQPHLVSSKVLLRDRAVLGAELPDSKKVGGDGVFREVGAIQVSFKVFIVNHGERPPFTMIILISTGSAVEASQIFRRYGAAQKAVVREYKLD